MSATAPTSRSARSGPVEPVGPPDGSAATAAAAAVEVRGVSRRFASRSGDVVALSDVDLTVRAGEFVSLIGPSGCGKSTLLRLIADLDRPTGGELTVFGRPPHVARQNHDFGIAFQQAGLLPWRSVRANVELPLELHGTGRAARRARAAELLGLVGLADFADHRPDQLSGGMQQRVAIARALAESPSLLLMDEPFGALDEMTREHVQTELLRLRAESGAAVVFVTHSIPEAVYLSDRVVVMSARPGRVREIVPVALGSAGDRTEELREDDQFFDRVRAVREALHGTDPADGTARGVDQR
ncbi:ABC transporter ATP-binding protein [Isoptericola halotolerans]|uniref:NitT/TauT family transport system ATP-binding protein n=1 Tax=Isoptericola halotolerans TaxID=300560 RepID=A0ABX2A265_9MICO|nr:ABC transporter ATP-binding protein [Isoptericola halotolerans]NOV96774.1 NitT/TauT family transport system ATP-binding protein [Isoptericola halotolerans]